MKGDIYALTFVPSNMISENGSIGFKGQAGGVAQNTSTWVITRATIASKQGTDGHAASKGTVRFV